VMAGNASTRPQLKDGDLVASSIAR